MRLSAFLLASFFTVALHAQAPKETAARAEALRVADVWLDGVQAYQHIPAISAGVVVGDDLVWSAGYGTIDAAHSVPATPQTIYSICSISKLFTSISLMQLYEQGKVSLDVPITTYLPWATMHPAEDSGPVTLRGLMTHSSGIPREAADVGYWTVPDYPFPTEETIRAKIAGQTALYPAGRYFQYSNLGLTLVGETVEAVSHEPYATYAQTHVLTPLGLNDTRTYMPMDLYGKRLAVGYGALKRDGTRDVLKPFNTRGVTPAAGYTSTVEDLGKFASWQFRLLRTGHADVLKAPTLREMQRVQFMDPDWKTSWGLGFAVGERDDHTYVGHGGDCPGYHTTLSMRNDDQTAVIVLDTGAEGPGPFARNVFAILDKRKGYKFKTPEPASGVNLEDYVGRYSGQPWASESVVLPWAGGLVHLSLPSADPANAMTFLKPKGGDIFRRVRKDGSEAEEFTFQRDASGKVTGFVHFSNPELYQGPLGKHR
ncbi:MAG: serine hydrolase [Acidobacteriota bacterium]|nr:serine hydrolase [Acidobacteriota bacterium]